MTKRKMWLDQPLAEHQDVFGKKLFAEMIKRVGYPCPTFASGCASCEFWLAWSRLANIFDKN